MFHILFYSLLFCLHKMHTHTIKIPKECRLILLRNKWASSDPECGYSWFQRWIFYGQVDTILGSHAQDHFLINFLGSVVWITRKLIFSHFYRQKNIEEKSLSGKTPGQTALKSNSSPSNTEINDPHKKNRSTEHSKLVTQCCINLPEKSNKIK